MDHFLQWTTILLLSTSCLAQQSSGLFMNDSTAFPGYTLFSNNEKTYLINNCGLIVNQWESDYKPGESVYLLDNGNLLRTAKIESNFGLGGTGGVGGRLELFNWDNELLWHFHIANSEIHSHHDIEPLPNGNILITAWEKHSAAEAQQMGRIHEGEVWSERIMELEMKGTDDATVIWEWRLWDHLIQDQNTSLVNYGNIADHPELVNINYLDDNANSSGNWIHLNSIDYNQTLDQILLSSRLFSEVWIIDHSTSTAEAASHTGGQLNKGGDLLYRYGNPQTYNRGTASDQIFRHQHDARWIPDGYPDAGKLMIFNNEKENESSGIEIWSPTFDSNGNYEMAVGVFLPESVDWSYTAPGFYSQYMSGAHLLPNGNIFICEGSEGHFFEVDSNEQLVWEYINPVNSNGGPAIQGGTIRFNQTFRATKYAHDYPGFEGKDLTPGLPVELSPWENDCFIPAVNENNAIEIKIIGNPVYEKLVISSNSFKEISIEIINVNGQVLSKGQISEGINHLDVAKFPSGLYCLIFSDSKNFNETQKFIKL